MAFNLKIRGLKIKRRNIQRYLPWVVVVVILAIAIIVWQGYREDKVVLIEPSLRTKKININFESLEGPLSEVPLEVTDPVLEVSLTANPSEGSPPLENVDLLAEISGTAAGSIDYRFDCTNDGTYELEAEGQAEESYSAFDLCRYEQEGEYTARVFVKRGDKETEKTIPISVVFKNNFPEITLCRVIPASGTTQTGFQFNFLIEVVDLDGDPLVYDWDFGDGTERSDEQNPIHHYEQSGTYLPNVTVYDIDQEGNKKGGTDICFLSGGVGLFQKLKPFEEIQPFEGEIGRENPFLPY